MMTTPTETTTTLDRRGFLTLGAGVLAVAPALAHLPLPETAQTPLARGTWHFSGAAGNDLTFRSGTGRSLGGLIVPNAPSPAGSFSVAPCHASLPAGPLPTSLHDPRTLQHLSAAIPPTWAPVFHAAVFEHRPATAIRLDFTGVPNPAGAMKPHGVFIPGTSFWADIRYEWGYVGGCIRRNTEHVNIHLRNTQSNSEIFNFHLVLRWGGYRPCLSIYESASGWCSDTCTWALWNVIWGAIYAVAIRYFAAWLASAIAAAVTGSALALVLAG